MSNFDISKENMVLAAYQQYYSNIPNLSSMSYNVEFGLRPNLRIWEKLMSFIEVFC